MDPVSITTLVVTICGLVLGVFQSIRSNHFQSECFGCCKMSDEYKGKDAQ